jgi:hypothetical protein
MNKKIRKGYAFDNGGTVMPDVGPRRAEPNLDQKFKKGGKSCRSMGGAMDKADKGQAVLVKKTGGCMTTRSMGGAMDKAGKGQAVMVKKTGGSMMKRAMGGVAKERKGFPFT